MEAQKRLYRSNNKMFLGVCAGLAEYFNLDPALVRVLFVILALTGGHGLLIYLILAAVMLPADRVTG
jgi:phage shock protein PspC (stress-responsive transcriptional regulator)